MVSANKYSKTMVEATAASINSGVDLETGPAWTGDSKPKGGLAEAGTHSVQDPASPAVRPLAPLRRLDDGSALHCVVCSGGGEGDDGDDRPRARPCSHCQDVRPLASVMATDTISAAVMHG